MVALRTSLLIFATLLNNSFVIYHRPKVTEAFVCFNKDNDTWPEQWTRLNAVIEDGIPTLRTTDNLPKNKSLVDYKLRFIFPDRSVGDSQWKQILNASIDYLCNTNNFNSESNGILISSTVVSIIIAFLFCIIHFIKKCLINKLKM